MPSSWQRLARHCYDASTTDGDTVPATALAHASSTSPYLPSNPGHLTFHSARQLCADARCGCTSERFSIVEARIHSHYSLDSGAEMAAASVSLAVVSNDDGMIGTEDLSVQTVTMRVQWCVSPINVLLTVSTFSRYSLLSVGID